MPAKEPMNHLVLAPQLAPSGGALMIVARRLVAQSLHPGRVRLGAIDLEVRTGAFVLVLGQAGPTLVRLLAGLERPERGALRVGDVPLETLSDSEALAYRRRGVNLVLSSDNLLPDLTLQQNLELSLLLTDLPRRERHERARSALEFVGLGPYSARRADRVSMGAAQRAAIARTLLTGANLLVLDEPCAHVEAAERVLVLDLLTQLNRVFRKTIVFASREQAIVDRASQVEVLPAPSRRSAVQEDFAGALRTAGAVPA